jgi:hypothetical protein
MDNFRTVAYMPATFSIKSVDSLQYWKLSLVPRKGERYRALNLFTVDHIGTVGQMLVTVLTKQFPPQVEVSEPLIDPSLSVGTTTCSSFLPEWRFRAL